ncbi:30S ribosomal protein S1 [Buchnera aphidicola]|uniref:Small ribosomal subunit protein bS1 n=1 Tax=Buchnera aphidicola subsp. Tuberolachnus salignus TaxID=98804 RepID=A0A160SVZ5_BUCTT|nr:30S ribosomal protein S1 [Buchnera aphidicola]CUR53177.1 30S ribosomal protein S1 [Buchnera aphidicola (Tuberolachnus salignus)]
MTISFSELFEKSLKKVKTRPGSIIPGLIISIKKDIVLVDAGLKSECSIPIEQFKNSKGKIEVKIGDIVDVSLDAIEDGFGETALSRDKAKRHEAWLCLEKAYEKKSIVLGVINGKVKGGFTVELNDIRAFLPGSLVDIRPVRETNHLEGKELEFKVIKLDQRRNNVVVSRRAVIESENSAERLQLLENLKEGLIVKGIVKNLTDYGAFIDLGGADGLLHITDMAWKRVKHPSEIVNIGDDIQVKILKFDKEKTRVSLGLKQLGIDPWIDISKRYPIGFKLQGKVTNLTDYGCFVEIQEGVEGLVHVSEMDWTNKNIHPSKVVKTQENVQVTVLDIDENRRRISLGLKQCKTNPWKVFSEKYQKGHQVFGKIKSITDFGIFIGLEGGIDGLVHLSDISWGKISDTIIKKYKKGDEISAVVLQVDSERERISLGIKQLKEDPFNTFLLKNKKNTLIDGIIFKITEKILIVNLKKNLEGHIKINNSSLDSNNENKNLYSIGDVIQTKLIGFDRKNRIIHLSLLSPNSVIKNKKNSNISNINPKKDVSNVMTVAFEEANNSE